jgi:predicted AlkP superfamily phosphohydrolase/phosphomutase
MDYYRQIDEFIGDRVDKFLHDSGGDLSRLFLLSDHGFCGIQQEVRLNQWLKEKGFLKFAKESPQEVCDLDPSSQAFFLDPARLYLNRKDRFPGGWIEPDHAPRILEEIEAGLRTLECQGNPVIRWTFRGSEVYEGPYAGQSPDLLVVPHWGYDLKATVKEKDLFGRTDLEGMHTWDDAFFWSQAPQEGEFEISRIARLLIDALD